MDKIQLANTKIGRRLRKQQTAVTIDNPDNYNHYSVTPEDIKTYQTHLAIEAYNLVMGIYEGNSLWNG